MAIDSLSLKDQLQKSKDWPAAQKAAQILQGGGFKCYLAGGCIRDALLGKRPSDFDVVTDAADEDLTVLFPKSYSVGKSFGVLIVPLEGAALEVAQFRTEEGYSDGRRPDHWQKATPEEDAKRRDFTVNALFYDMSTSQVLDFVGGHNDLKKRVLRCVGDPAVRLAEDKLRLFRAVRFVAQLGFDLEPATEQALRASSSDVFQVSPERRKEELLKLLKTERPHIGLSWMEELHWLKPWGVGLEVYGDEKLQDPVYSGSLKDAGYKFLKFLGQLKRNFEGSKPWWTGREPESAPLLQDECYVLALLLAPWRGVSDKNAWSSFVQKHLVQVHKFSSEEAKVVGEGFRLLEGFYRMRNTDEAFWQKASRSRAGCLVHELLGLEEEALTGCRTQYLERAGAYEFKERPLPEPLVRGRDLQGLGLKPSPQWGQVLNEAYHSQLNGHLKSEAEALEWVKSKLEI